MREATLYDLGLTVTFFHTDGSNCYETGQRRTVSTVSQTGIQDMAYYQCLCFDHQKGPTASPSQFVANKFIPATHNQPVTVFSFDLLNHFDVLNLESAINVKQFLHSVVSITPERFRLSEEVSVQ